MNITVIRSKEKNGHLYLVTTVFNPFYVAFQIYETHKTGRATLTYSSPYSTEQGAIDAFNEATNLKN